MPAVPLPSAGPQPIKSPPLLRCRDAQSIRHCLAFLSRLSDQPGQMVTLDCRHLTFIDPAPMVLLHFFAAQRSGPVVVALPENKVTRGVIQENLNNRGRLQRPNHFPLRYIPREEDLSEELGAWREMLVDSGSLREEDARGFSSTLSEVLTNSFAHGKASGKAACIVAGQTFPKKGHTILAAVDRGLGIATTLRESHRYDDLQLAQDHEWMLHALKRGVTCKSLPINRGYGLFHLERMVRQNGGSMYVVSESGLVYVAHGSEPIGVPLRATGCPRFPGTLLVLDLNTGEST